ncbi:E3 ubiquitin/ISG15 ligase TRIM25-like [Echeneis naucrates]|uniref:E3 ubiquitin/ISG15 ligase TRIM25-like n=1 Tax=Echeneis naucrates TaxID=173247 RepID=A0A665T903_ECHNA|nr:E3 ubiquitin/ISG15 ligase TRIM25-like [Echeneis naucrates]
MSAASCFLMEDQFLCSICLDVFTDPVTLPCGHNFCNTCITNNWDVNTPYRCPVCQRLYFTRPELHVNTFISGMAAQFRQSVQRTSSSSSLQQQAARPGEVPCEVCAGPKLKALKSCLVCLASYCETHLEPHLTVTGLKRHQLIDPVENLEGRMCSKHDKLLELFCKTDQMFVCFLCTYSDHKNHDIVPLKEEYEGKKAELKKRNIQIQQMIQKRHQKLQEIKHSVDLSKQRADREIAEGVQVFTALKASVDRDQAEFIKTIKEELSTTEKQAEGFIKDLEEEISELKKRSAEVEQLSRSEDHLHLIQSISSLTSAKPTKDWTKVRVRPQSYAGTVRRTLIQLETTVSEQITSAFVAEIKRLQHSAVAVTFDPRTVPPKRSRSNNCRCVFDHHGFTSGRFYFQLQVSRWSRWTFGVATDTYKTGRIRLSPRNGFWTLSVLSGRCFASGKPAVLVSPEDHYENVGVLVDYDEGLVLFYDTDSAGLIYSFTDCLFGGKLYPFFSPCDSPRGDVDFHEERELLLH